ncbi:MAG: 50S ribosomal protein L22 [Candidatus Harrisonbacteria bacterium CG10_big_fil_rev_8_21_14_0_10_42_17]|uniref:Large ribosomal subunit protein uL22 n=1 Tax=Candidatus Harrisonbacteria bacterium CG10_big_fil_rev_8_21_14_0_10_42_17 TaxID=1974584 RepID=A0A2M6WHL5_9BACT|nr:MAG: 50S ribosomal protein L22 [Candidatus Harrisonbacteria bacterium CG10_big_fil_rev_8_21_14_0_10_42_17]
MSAQTQPQPVSALTAPQPVSTLTVRLRFLHVAPRKVRLVAYALRGLLVQEAEAQLLNRSQRSAPALLKLLRSALANAKHNHSLEPNQLFIKAVFVDQGPVFKRIMPRAQGRATPIQKKTSHITLTLATLPAVYTGRFSITTPTKDEVASKKREKEKLRSKGKKAKQPEGSLGTDVVSSEKPASHVKQDAKVGQLKKQQEKPSGVLKKMFRRKSV